MPACGAHDEPVRTRIAVRFTRTQMCRLACYPLRRSCPTPRRLAQMGESPLATPAALRRRPASSAGESSDAHLLILEILVPCSPRPAMSPFWLKKKA
jgi:hypothetical protein